MSRCLLFPMGSDLPARLADLLLEEGRDGDFSRCAVVFPNDRPRLYLNKYLGGKVGRAFLPPVFFSMDRFMLHLAGGADMLESLDETAFMVEALLSAEGKTLSLLSRDPALAFFWAATVSGAVEELDIELVTDASLREVRLATEETSVIARALLEDLSGLRRRFHKALEASGKVTRGLAYARAASACGGTDVRIHDRLWIVLPPGVTKAERKVFQTLAPRHGVHFLSEGGMPPGLDLPVSVERIEGAAGRPRIRLYSGFDAHSEILGLKEILSARKPSTPAVIVLPKPESLIPLLEHVLSTLDTSFNISLGYPFVRTPVYALLSTLFALQRSAGDGRYAARDYIDFLLHPYIKNLGGPTTAEGGRILVHALERKLIDLHVGRTALADLENDDAFFEKVSGGAENAGSAGDLKAALKSIHDVFIRPLERVRTPDETCLALQAALRHLLARSPAAAYPLSGEYFKTALDFLEGLAGSPLAGLRPPRRLFLFDLVEILARGVRVPFEGSPLEGLQVLGLLETRALAFDRVYVLDANEEVLPSVKVEDPLLPLEIRRHLGLPGPSEKEALQAHHFKRLLAGASEVHLFYIQSEGEAPSRYIVEHIWEEEKKAGRVGVCVPSALNVELAIKAAAPPSAVKTPAVMDVLGKLSWSSSALDRYLRCPMQFYFERVMGLRERDRIEEEAEATGVGTLLHAVLEALYRGVLNRRLSASDYGEMKARVPQILDETFKAAGWEKRGERYLIHTLMRDRIGRFLNKEIREGTMVPLHVELFLEGDLEGFHFRGKLDRVDEFTDGLGSIRRILDYKSGPAGEFIGMRKAASLGAAPRTREEMAEAVGSFQMPVYAWLAHARFGWEYGSMRVETQSLRDLEDRTRLFHKGTDADAFMHTLGIGCILNLLKEILDPGTPFTADLSKSTTCEYCSYGAVCRRR